MENRKIEEIRQIVKELKNILSICKPSIEIEKDLKVEHEKEVDSESMFMCRLAGRLDGSYTFLFDKCNFYIKCLEKEIERNG